MKPCKTIQDFCKSICFQKSSGEWVRASDILTKKDYILMERMMNEDSKFKAGNGKIKSSSNI